MNEEDNWIRAERMVLSDIRRLTKTVDSLTDEVTALKVELATLTTVVQIKSGVWGALAGMIPAVIMLIFWFLSGGRK